MSNLIIAVAALASVVLYIMHFVWMSRIAADVRRLADAQDARAGGRRSEQPLTWTCPQCSANPSISAYKCACGYSLK